LILFALVIATPTVLGMAWVTWIALRQQQALASRGMKMAEEVQRECWSASLTRTHPAELAGLTASIENSARAQAAPPPRAPDYSDEIAMQRM
jgi:hypothetical protein